MDFSILIFDFSDMRCGFGSDLSIIFIWLQCFLMFCSLGMLIYFIYIWLLYPYKTKEFIGPFSFSVRLLFLGLQVQHLQYHFLFFSSWYWCFLVLVYGFFSNFFTSLFSLIHLTDISHSDSIFKYSSDAVYFRILRSLNFKLIFLSKKLWSLSALTELSVLIWRIWHGFRHLLVRI